MLELTLFYPITFRPVIICSKLIIFSVSVFQKSNFFLLSKCDICIHVKFHKSGYFSLNMKVLIGDMIAYVNSTPPKLKVEASTLYPCLFKASHSNSLWTLEFIHSFEHIGNPQISQVGDLIVTGAQQPRQIGLVMSFGPYESGASFITTSPALMFLAATTCLQIEQVNFEL